MALFLQHNSLSITTLVTLFSILLNLNPSCCFNPKLFNVSKLQSDSDWSPAGATWYGPADGAGTDGKEFIYQISIYWSLIRILTYVIDCHITWGCDILKKCFSYVLCRGCLWLSGYCRKPSIL